MFYKRSECEDTTLFRESVREFVQKKLIPSSDDWEKLGYPPKELWKELAQMGYLGISYPEKWGGQEAPFSWSAVFLEELGKCRMGGLSAAVGVHSYIACPYLEKLGTEAIKEDYLKPALAGEKIGCLAITEPGCGSDVAGIEMTAIETETGYILNGTKIFITNGLKGDFAIVAAKTEASLGVKGVSLFLIDLEAPGITRTGLKKLGWHSSDTAEIHLDEVTVSKDRLLGEKNKGFYAIMDGFQLERLIMALISCGMIEDCLEFTIQYLKERVAFSKPLSSKAVLRHRLAHLSARHSSLKTLVYQAALEYEEGVTNVELCTVAKLLSSELSVDVSNECLQMHGGYGYMEEYPVARLMRDSRVNTIAGGTSEIMCEILGKSLFA